jgi:drug/metabolite transporter (DMT)-like permease
MNNNLIRGSVLIAAAACCYGMLGTFVKMAYLDGFTTAEVTVSQFVLGFLSLLALSFNSQRRISGQPEKKAIRKSYFKMITAGASLGLTSICYYMAVKYIAVSLGIVLLMQAVWMSIVLESILQKRFPGMLKIISVFIILIGTVLATGVLHHSKQINLEGIGWGLLAAASYTATIYSSNNVQLQLPPLKRSFLMISGGLIVVLLVFFPALMHGFSLKIFLSWGLLVSLFGTILPPILFTKGMPLTGMGLGAMLTSLEVPVSIIIAHYILGESISLLQWLGVIIILMGVIVINWSQNMNTKEEHIPNFKGKCCPHT